MRMTRYRHACKSRSETPRSLGQKSWESTTRRMDPFDYQLRAVDELREAIKRHKSAVYVLPTGAGKTVVAGLIAQRVTERADRSCSWFTGASS